MTVTAIPGPAINYGISLSSSGATRDYNEERGPSLNDLGEGTLDPRAQFCYQPGSRPGTPVYAWPGCFGGPCVDFIPIALNSSGIAANQTSTAAAGTLTLTSSANSSSFRSISGFIPSTVPVSNPSSITVLMLDGYQGGVAVGQGSTSVQYGVGCGFGQPISAYPSSSPLGPQTTINIWNPLVMGGRCLTLTSTANNSGTTYVISGYDVYGLQMTQTLIGPNNSTVTTSKAFKYITSITYTTASSTSIYVGTADVYGFPLYVDSLAYAQVTTGPSSGAVLTTNSSQHTFGYGSSLYGVVPTLATGPSTGTALLLALSSGGDVRGTYTSSGASTGNTQASGSTGWRVVMNISPRVSNLVTVSQNSFWGLVGLPQV